MPTYDYHCETCELDFELEQGFSEDTLTKCPTKKSGRNPAGCAKSGRGKVVKVFSAPGITFRGSGFYKNDSRSKVSAGASNGSESGSSESNGAKAEGSAEASSSEKDGDKSSKKSSDAKADSSTKSSEKTSDTAKSGAKKDSTRSSPSKSA